MGVFVFLPLVLPLTAWPIARLAEQHLHPRTATRLLTAVAVVMALCSTLCLALVMVVGTAQLPGNPLPDGWSDPEVRAAVPYDEVVGKAAIPALCAVVAASARTLWRHRRVRRAAHRALAGLPGTGVAVLPDDVPYAYALPGGHRDRVVVSTALLDCLEPGSGARCSPTSVPISPAGTTASCSPYGWPHWPTRSCARCGPPCPTRRSGGRTRRPHGRSATGGRSRPRSARRPWSPAARPSPPSPVSRRPARCRAGWRPCSAPPPRSAPGPGLHLGGSGGVGGGRRNRRLGDVVRERRRHDVPHPAGRDAVLTGPHSLTGDGGQEVSQVTEVSPLLLHPIG